MKIQIKPLDRKTDHLFLRKPSTALQFRKNELLQLAAGRSFVLELATKSSGKPWVEIEVIDGRKHKFQVEVFDRFVTRYQCSCEDFVLDESNCCVHIAAIENVRANQAAYKKQDINVGHWCSGMNQQVMMLPFSLSGFRNPKFVFYDSNAKQEISYGGSLPGSIASVAVATARRLRAQKALALSNTSLPDQDDTDLLREVSLYDYQKTIFNKMVKAKRAICSMTMGSGKAQPLTAKILTPTGWTTMGQLKVGDFVIGSNGKSTKITGIFPQGIKDIYRVGLSDGSSTECCEEHLWSFYGPKNPKRPRKLKTKMLRDIKDRLYDNQGNARYFLPTIQSVEFDNDKEKLSVHPYLLGVLLGDGGLSQKTIHFTCADKEILERIQPMLPNNVGLVKVSKYDYCLSTVDRRWKKNIRPTNELASELRKLGLMGRYSWNKTIPPQYLVSSISNRIALLQGLMDTDGSTSGNTVEYVSTSFDLAEGVRHLAMSLGGVATISKKKTHYSYKGNIRQGREAYRVILRMPVGTVPFLLTRKVEKFIPKTKYQPIRSIASVEYVGKKEAQCVSVDANDHLYTTDDYILTHNTITTLACYAWLRKNVKPNAKLLVVCPKSLRLQWAGEIQRVLDLPSVQVMKTTDLEIKPKHQRDIFIATYQFFTRHCEEFAKHEYDCVVVDEVQFVKNNETKTWKAISKVKSDYFYGLSGTVIENRLDDLYSIMEIIDPGHLGPKWRFDDQYQNLLVMTKTKALYKGVKNLPALRQELQNHVFSYDQLSLPKITHNFVRTTLSHAEQTAHDGYMEEARKLIAKVLNGSSRPQDRLLIQAFLLKARQACNGNELLTKKPSVKPSSKIQEFLNIVDEVCVAKDEKLVVFSEWTEMLNICKRFVGNGVGYVSYTGAESTKQRQAALTKFQKDPDCKIFFSSDAGGVGLDGLQLVCSNVLHSELPWNPSRLDQRTGRVYRLLQKKDVNVYYLISNGAIEKQIENLLSEKREIRTLTLKDLSAV